MTESIESKAAGRQCERLYPRLVRLVEHWHWRQYMAEELAKSANMEDLGILAIYLFGSTSQRDAGMNSDIDLLVHFDGTPEQRWSLEQWLDGWSCALAKTNFLITGFDAGRLLDVHIITDQDIRDHTGFAVQIANSHSPAYLLRERTHGVRAERRQSP